MDSEIYQNCRHYIIKTIINPHRYLMIPREEEKSYYKKVKRLEKGLAKKVTKVPYKEKLCNGMIVAIKNKTGFQRAAIQDMFSKFSEVIYKMFLVDHGTVVDISEKNVYYINDEAVRDKHSGMHNLFLHDIAPAAVEIECHPSINFKKRACKDWSPYALSFVNSLLSINSCVFFKAILCKPHFISGEIYFLKKPEDKLVSLGELLCSRNFAIRSPKLSESMEGYMEGKVFKGDLSIEEDIPINTLIQKTCDKLKSHKIGKD